jgi:hypothetical protein
MSEWFQSALICFTAPSDLRFPNSRNGCPDTGQTAFEQQFLPHFPVEMWKRGLCVIDGPWFAQNGTDTRAS